jgi:O-antigen/teichoic acid export membrane protein
MSETSFRRVFVHSVSWTALSQVASQLVIFGTTVLLARLLVPEDFGVVGMATLFTGLIAMVGEIGLGAALIQRSEISREHLDTVFSVSIVVSSVLCVVSVAAAPLAAQFFRETQVAAVVRVSSLAFVLTALGAVHRVLLEKEMDFKKLALIEISSVAVYAASSVTLALAGLGALSLAVGFLTRSATESLLLWRAERWRPRWAFDGRAFRMLFGFGASVWLHNFVNYARENIDYIAVGRMLGASSLGFYTLAYNLANLPRRQLSTVVGRVAFPAFSRVKDDDALLRRSYLKVLRYVSMVSFPLLVGLALVAPQFVPIVYGVKWAESILPLQLLCGAGALYSLGAMSGPLYLAKGRADLQLRIGLGFFVALVVMVLVGIRWGIVGVAGAVLVYTLSSWLTGQAYANKLVGLSMVDYLRALLPASGASVLMIVVLLGYRAVGLAMLQMPTGVWLLTAVSLGAAVYFAALWFGRVPERFEIMSAISARIAPCTIVNGESAEVGGTL